MYKIRAYSPDDAFKLLKLFCQTIQNVNSNDYTPEQIDAWANYEKRKPQWQETFEQKSTWVCHNNDQLTGFCELKDDGHIDRFYIDHEHIGRGIGQQLYQELEVYAISLGLKQLRVDASITAKPFFIKMGFSNPKEQTVFIGDVAFINYLMTKDINS